MTTLQTKIATEKTIPAVPGRPFIGSLRDFQRNPLGFSLEIAQSYGDIARVTLLGEESIFVNDPDAIQHVLQTNSRNYDKQTMDYQLLYPLVGRGLLTSDGDAWLPFSAGARKCIGDQFAMTEGQLILASVAQRFDLALAPDQRIDTAALITLNPKHGMSMIAQGRR